jgi:glycosyltransferase 2 family protein
MNKSDNSNTPINWKLWAGLFISAIFLFLAFRGVDLPHTWLILRNSNFSFLFLAIVITFFQFVIRAWRWRVLLKPVKETGFSNRLLSTLIGFAGNCIFPARLGEFIRANYLGQREGISGSSVFGSIVIERIFDGFTLLLVLMIGLLAINMPDELSDVSGKLKGTGITIFIVYILIVIFLIGFKYRTNTFILIIEKILFFLSNRFRSKIVNIVRNFSEGLVPMENSLSWGLAVFYSFFLWFTSLLQICFIEASIGISLPFITTFILLSIASFGVMIPSAPGFVGTFHLAVQYGFLFYGVAKEEATAAAILWHAAFFFPTIIFGIAALLILHVSIKNFADKSAVGDKGRV